ncbi:MAG: chloride channel protein [Pseudobdellovibrionaceae bacterium]
MKRGDFSTNGRLFFLGAISVAIGATAAVVALILVNLISSFTNLFFFGRFSFEQISPAKNQLGIWVILIPALGGLIIGLMARFGSERIRGHGIPEALEAILFGKSIMQPKVAILKPISSAISIGSGGPFGAEGPVIMTGGAVGSLIAQLFHVTASERKTLLVAGAAAGMSAIFASPIAAVLLAVELLLFEWKPRSLFPVALASITASALRPVLLGMGPVFPFQGHFEISSLGLLACCAVGAIAGIFSTAVSTLLYKMEDAFHRLPFHWMWWCVVGGFVVGIGGYVQPRALGVGYDVISDLLNGNMVAQAALALLAVKSLIWMVSLASGTSGGVLAPLLMMGCGLGAVESLFLPSAFKSIYPLISMAAVMGGMMRAPFTAVIFALELTHNVDALVPTLTATIISYAVTVVIMKRSILTEKVARRGFDIFREYNVDPLETVGVAEVMTNKVQTIPANLPIEKIITKYFTGATKFRGYPVTGETGNLLGVLTASDVLDHRLRKLSLATTCAGDLAKENVVTIFPHQSCREAAEKMASLGIGRLPVISAEPTGMLIGIITRSDLLKPHLHQYELEQKRERIIKFKRWSH